MPDEYIKQFNNLERSNAQIDIWIDEEHYEEIWAASGIELESHANFDVKGCFPDDESEPCTFKNDSKWERALHLLIDAFPVVKINNNDLKMHEKNPVIKYWSHLFYAKYFRAKIQERSYSDCYIRHFDDVVSYLERHLPNPKGNTNEENNEQQYLFKRLEVVYLLELAASSLGWESIGYADRARRLIKEAKTKYIKMVQAAPFEFYELWARYNIGIAHFHLRNYKKSVLEFNKIIWQVEKWGNAPRNSREARIFSFFKKQLGFELLLLPAKLYRSEVQLKLQLAYHCLETLDVKKDKLLNNFSKFQKIRAQIIRTQAYHQIGRLDQSRKSQKELFGRIFNEKIEANIKTRPNILKYVVNKIYPMDIRNSSLAAIKEKFMDILIEDNLVWLNFNGKDPDFKPLKLATIVISSDEPNPRRYTSAVSEAKPYLEDLEKLLLLYHPLIKHNSENRRGYFQQLAKYLSWVSKAALVKEFAGGKCKKAANNLKKLALDFYHINKRALLEDEDKRSTSGVCPECTKNGIDLRRIEPEHFKWFTEDMLEFYKINGDNTNGKDKQKFILRLLKLELEEKDDLRVQDLIYRYQYWSTEELLKKLDDKAPIEHCWGQIPEEKRNHLQLFKCCGADFSETQDQNGKLFPYYLYQNTMKEWNGNFLRHIQYRSYHDSQKEGFYFLGLQRWNSSSPAKGFSVGGGYLIWLRPVTGGNSI